MKATVLLIGLAKAVQQHAKINVKSYPNGPPSVNSCDCDTAAGARHDVDSTSSSPGKASTANANSTHSATASKREKAKVMQSQYEKRVTKFFPSTGAGDAAPTASQGDH